MKKLHFTCDPLSLVRLALQRYAEEAIEGKTIKATQFAIYSYLSDLTDEELENLLERYVVEENLEAITLDDWRKDARFLFSYIFESDRFKNIEIDYKKKGHNKTGYGVFDKKSNTFYDCDFTKHWEAVLEIMKKDYPELHEALEKISYECKEEYNGITKKQLDDFILNNFELTGQNNELSFYLEELDETTEFLKREGVN